MTKINATIEYGPFISRADQAVKDSYLFNLAGFALDQRRCGFGGLEIGETLVAYADGDLTFEEAVIEFGGTIEPTPFDLVAHLERQRAFSLETFGPGPRTQGVLDHIRKELAEIEAEPADIAEWVDVIILAFDGAWRAGWEPAAIVEAIVAKQTKNEARQWPDWRTADPDKAIEHVRSEDDAVVKPHRRWIMGEPVNPETLGDMVWLPYELAINHLHVNTFMGRWREYDENGAERPDRDRIAFCTMNDDADILALGDTAGDEEPMQPSWRIVGEPDEILVPRPNCAKL